MNRFRQFKRKIKPITFEDKFSNPQKIKNIQCLAEQKKLTSSEKQFLESFQKVYPEFAILPQYVIDCGTDRVFIVDFYIPAFDLIVEIDGAYHKVNRTFDFIRETSLKANGYKILRLNNNTCKETKTKSISKVIQSLFGTLKPRPMWDTLINVSHAGERNSNREAYQGKD